ncbi:MAG: Proline--tRNA ligase [Alphaproteobacteria bacterium MarineAlpha5_Bin8]|nr:MAG: Proline--tRNA ligase [Alphaproteobacteria bacterium MarineAlpha5_Bin7]PPR47495.1 MAG: Proline--tRNA ligase [Alphaproteobacteria bacterium MarineAlpha5_Bin8]|tara:strand:+ start:9354 stop:10655 length:1302 start_codon:yes stop_codon:yes gene_type:complete
MKFSNYFIPTLKNNPADAEIVSHQLMIRAGMIKQSSAGIYSWLPLGLRVLKKIEEIVRQEQNNSGAIEILMPTIQSADLWVKSGRYEDYGKELLRFKDRGGREMLYGPTNEELITEIFQSYVNSYKDLPLNLYHIQWKFRDELRPRFGVMRGREFLMKDNYSFDLNEEDAKISYNNMFTAYIKTFLKLGLTPISLRADTGPIGGNLSHEFQVLASTGESTLYYDKELESINPENIEPEKLQSYYAAVDDLHDKDNCPIDEKNLKISKGIEVGHIFYFGTKYSEKLNANVQNNNGEKIPVHMGSYGIGVSRLVGAIIEAFHDDKGIIWPIQVAPFKISLINLMPDDKNCKLECDKLYEIFINENIDILYDDRVCSIGKKLSDNDLIGTPYHLIVGKRDLINNLVELKERKTNISKKLTPEEACNFLIKQINSKK